MSVNGVLSVNEVLGSKRAKLSTQKKPQKNKSSTQVTELSSSVSPFAFSNEELDQYLRVSQTMQINVVVDRVFQYSYRVFNDMPVSSILADIKNGILFSGMYADIKHDIRVLLPENIACSQLKTIFNSDNLGIVAIYFSTAANFTMM